MKKKCVRFKIPLNLRRIVLLSVFLVAVGLNLLISVSPAYAITQKEILDRLTKIFSRIKQPFFSTQPSTTNPTEPLPLALRGIEGDLWADIVIGQQNFENLSPNEIVPDKIYNPFGGGVIVDRRTDPGLLYVWDGGNSRILGIDLADCYATSGSCRAKIVIGQPSGDHHGACNGDSNLQRYPLRAPASASTLCGIPETQLSISEAITIANLYVDQSNGDLFVPDIFNSRVLKFTDPFVTDTVADAVWGQENFSGNYCNRSSGDLMNVASPTAQSLCFRYSGGVALDNNGNLWVVDSFNNRVVRYPKNQSTGVVATTADLVLGQTNFTSRTEGSGLDQMNNPEAIRFDQSGNLYVVDSGNNRVLLFAGGIQFTNGISATKIFGSNMTCPHGIEIDPNGQGVWIQDDCHSRLLLWDFSGTTIKKIIGKDTQNNLSVCSGTICNSVGSIGIDSRGNILVANGRYIQDVLRFDAPIPDSRPNFFYQPSKKLFLSKGIKNQRGSANLDASVTGLEVTDNQLIIADGRILFWNNLDSFYNGKPADGVIVPGPAGWPQSFDSTSPWDVGNVSSDGQRLWVVVGTWRKEVWIYNLPLSTGALPLQRITLPLPVLGGGQIDFQGGFDGLLVTVGDNDNSAWFSFPNTSRVVRVRDPLVNPRIDVVLGQKDITGTQCNRGEAPAGARIPQPSADMLCQPGAIAIDHYGNLFVSDHSLEVAGNFRLLEFNASLFPSGNTTVIFAPLASKVFPYRGGLQSAITFKPAFDSSNRMVVGYNGYLGGRFVGVYNNPLSSSTDPDTYLKDYWSMPYTAVFDIRGNLYVADLNRARVLIYKNPFGVTVPTSTPRPTVTPSPTVTPTLTPTSTPTPTPTPAGKSFSMYLVNGWNFIGLPLEPTSPLTAESLLNLVSGQGGNCSEINRWYAGGWQAHIKDQPFNNFTIDTYKAYFLKCSQASTLRINGNDITVDLREGLEFINSQGYQAISIPSGPYTAESLLQAIDIAIGGQTREIARWYAGGWNTYVKGLPMNNFTIEKGQGYFLKYNPQVSSPTPTPMSTPIPSFTPIPTSSPTPSPSPTPSSTPISSPSPGLPADFTIFANPNSGSIAPGGSITTTVNALMNNTRQIYLNAGAVPSGVTITLNPNTCSLPCQSVLTIRSDSSVVTGTYRVRIMANFIVGEGVYNWAGATEYTLTITGSQSSVSSPNPSVSSEEIKTLLLGSYQSTSTLDLNNDSIVNEIDFVRMTRRYEGE